jgi:hypothetical protein
MNYNNPLFKLILAAVLGGLVTATAHFVSNPSRAQYVAYALDKYCESPQDVRMQLREAIAASSREGNSLVANCKQDAD